MIAILAAITVVAYNGIRGRAYFSAVQSDVHNAATKLGLYFAEYGDYPRSNAELESANLQFSRSAYHTKTIIYCVDALGHVGIGGRSLQLNGATGKYKGYYWSNANGFNESYDVGGSGTTTCPLYGVSMADGSGWWFSWGKATVDGQDVWQDWVHGS